jgi:DNA mismatch repair protein MutS2
MQIADSRTLDALDFASVRERVVGFARTERGRALARSLAPFADFGVVRREQIATAAIRELVAGADFHVGHAIDTAGLTESAALGRTLSPAELRSVAEAVAAAAAAYKRTRARPSDAIAHLTADYVPLNELVRALTDAIDERGTVVDRASPALGRIRRGLMQAQADARDRAGAIARSGNRAIQDAVVTIRDGRFVVPIKVEFSGEFGGIVHDSSSSGQTLFVEPLAAIETNNRVRTLRLEEEREVARILAALSRRVGEHAAQIERNVEMLAQLDLLASKARLASAMDAAAPVLSDEAEIEVIHGRHPLLGDRAIPQSLLLDGATRLLVISGPNMGGKTVALKMVGLFVAMTYAGLQIPAAEGTRIGTFSQMFADIGDEQSIVENTSTFSAHLRRMREILSAADARTLVLVDEIGGGTEPSAGAALAVAFLERLLALRACGIVTTHATELKLFAHGAQGVANASVRFDPQTFAPTYALDVGSPGQSLAFPLARSLGIGAGILDRAQALLDSQERDYEAALAELAQRNAELQVEREAVARERAHAADRQSELREQRDGLERQRHEFILQAEQRMVQALREFVTELARRASENAAARAKVTPSQSALLDRTLEAIRADLGITAETPGDRAQTDQLEVGDRVRILSLRQQGEVAEDFGDTVLIAMGALKMVVRKDDLQRIFEPGKERTRRESAGGDAKLSAAARTMTELDVRGKRFVEAEPIVERWIDEATLAGNSPLRLIHGKGTGLLGRGLQEFLRDHPAVVSVRYGNADEGDGGVTIVELK